MENCSVVHHDVEKKEPNTFPVLGKCHFRFTISIANCILHSQVDRKTNTDRNMKKFAYTT
jgi:hypothetical protein